MTPITRPEAELALRRTNRLSQATDELSKPPSRFPRLLICMAPPLLMILFGESLPRSLGLTSQSTWALLAVATTAMALGHQVILLQRKVAALTEIVRFQQQRDA